MEDGVQLGQKRNSTKLNCDMWYTVLIMFRKFKCFC